MGEFRRSLEFTQGEVVELKTEIKELDFKK